MSSIDTLKIVLGFYLFPTIISLLYIIIFNDENDLSGKIRFFVLVQIVLAIPVGLAALFACVFLY